MFPNDQSVSRCHANVEVSHPTGNITVSSSVMEQKTIAVFDTQSKPDEQVSTSRAGSSRKRLRGQEDDDSALVKKTKKINLEDLKDLAKKESGVTLIKRPLINKNYLPRSQTLNISIADKNSAHKGKPVKNFKAFKKVLPKHAYAGCNISRISEITSGSSGRSANTTTDSVRNVKPMKLLVKDYDPGCINYANNSSATLMPPPPSPFRSHPPNPFIPPPRPLLMPPPPPQPEIMDLEDDCDGDDPDDPWSFT